MSRIAVPLVLALAVAGVVHAQASKAPAAKKLYCWDEGGRKVCGDALPAEASGAARKEISGRSGMVIGQQARALNEDERAAAAVAAEAARKQAELDAAAKRRDLAMVESYMSEDDLRRAYGERTGLLDENIKTAQLGVDNLRQSLLALLRQAGDNELAGKPVPKNVAGNIRTQHDELLRQQTIITAQKADRAQLEIELNDAVARYRALKGVANPAAAAAGTDGAAAAAPGTPAAPAAPAN